jgi:8-oxo-dGTP diphosphatase
VSNPIPNGAILAAGGVAYAMIGKRRRFVVVHRPRYDDWSLPKGKLNKGETFLRAALREVEEETGVKPENPVEIGSIAYDTNGGNHKIVRWWLMPADPGTFKPNREVDEIAWLPPKAAMKRLQYRNERSVLERATEIVKSSTSGRIYLVRHGWAGQKEAWKKPDSIRPLDRRGRKQADAVAARLSGVGITRLLSSQFTRCIENTDPIGRTLGLPVETTKKLGVDASPDDTLKLIKQLRGESAVLCTHGQVIGDLIGKLDAEGIELQGPRKWKKGSIWMLETRRGQVKRGTHLGQY